MELGKYKQALRAMTKPSRLRTVIYDDTILEDSSTPEPYPGLSGPKVMPEFTPGIEPVMPTAPGMEDPSLRQIELADGGVVEREGFAKAGPVFVSEKEIESFKKEMKKKYPGLSVSEGITSGGKRQLRIRYTKKQGKEDKVVFDKARHLIPTKENLKILKEDASSFVKEAKEKGFEKISDPYELRGKQALEKTKDQQKLFNDILEKVNQGKDFKYNTLADKKVYRKLLDNIYEHNYLTGTGESQGRVFLRSIPETDIDTVLNKINNLPGLRDLNRGDIEYLIRQSYPQGSQARKDAFKNYRNYQRVANEIKNKFGTQFQLEHPLSRKAIETSGAGGIKESLLRVKAVPKVFNDFKNKYDVRVNEIQRDLLNPALRPQATEQLKSLNQIGKLMFEGYDVGELTSTGKVKKYGSDPFIKTDLVEGLKQSLNLNNQVKENIVKYKPQLTSLFESAGFKSTKLLERGEKLAPIAKQKQILNFIEKNLTKQIENIGCPTGALKAETGANCYVKGLDKINTGNLNKNEFNILQRTVKSPAMQKLGTGAKTLLKGLGVAVTPLMFYDTYSAYKEGKPIAEVLETGLIGTNIIGSIKDEMKLTPQEREARGVKQQYEREEQDVSGLSSDFYVPSTLSASEAAKITTNAENRIAEERALEEAELASQRIYSGDPGMLGETEMYAYGGRVGLKDAGDPKDKPILPINPMMDEGPQDPGKRDFLKGAGGIGLAGLLLGTGLLKLGKSAAVSSKIGTMVKNTTAPSWMEALITKVMKKGVDVPRPKTSVPDDTIVTKELKFKNPETGQMEEVQLRIDQNKDTIRVDYNGNSTVAQQGVTFELKPKTEIVYSKDGKYLTSKPVKGEYEFQAIESEPRVVNWDGDIEFDGEIGVKKIIDLNSDISGLKSYVTGGKGINKKIAQEKRIKTADVEENPLSYLADTYDSPYPDWD